MREIKISILFAMVVALKALPALAMTDEEIAEQSKIMIPQQIREQETEPLQTIPILQAQEEIQGSHELERKGTITAPQESLLQESAGTDQTGAIKRTDAFPLQEGEMGSNVLWHERENIDDTKILNMVNSLHCQYIQSLILPGNPLGDEAASAIAQHLPNLISLDLSETNISNEGVREIARLLVNLRSLNLSYVLIQKSGAKEMGSNLTNLERLDLIACQLRPSACAKIAMGLPKIRSLNMEHNHFDHEGILSLFTKPHPFLSFLNLKFNGIRDIEILRLSSSQWFNKLRKLNLSHNPVEKFTLRYISKHLTDLTVLEL